MKGQLRRRLVSALVAGIVLVVAGLGTRHVAHAKFSTTDLWLVGGDLPHPVKVPPEELANPGTREGEAFESYRHTPDDSLGPGYDLLVGTDLAGALGNVRNPNIECCETLYPSSSVGGVVAYWQSLTPTDTGRAEDRTVVNGEKASGGLYALIPRYVALAKAGLIGEQPTFDEAIAATEQLMEVQVLLDGTPRVDGTVLASSDAGRLAAMLPALPATEVLVPTPPLPGPFYELRVTFGTGRQRSSLLRYLYAPPNTLRRTGLLFPQLGPSPNAHDPAPSATAYQTTRALEAVLVRYGAISDADATGQSSGGQFPATGTGGYADRFPAGRRQAAPFLALLGISVWMVGLWCARKSRGAGTNA